MHRNVLCSYTIQCYRYILQNPALFEELLDAAETLRTDSTNFRNELKQLTETSTFPLSNENADIKMGGYIICFD